MSAIRTNAAAAMLGVSANTLRSWERRYGHPLPRRTNGGHRIFELAEIETLREVLCQTGDAGAAIAIARERGQGPSSPERLRLAFMGFSEPKADRLLEESLLVRSLERTVESVLLPAVETLQDATPERCFAFRYATGWLAAAKRVAPEAVLEQGVMVFDASARGSLDALAVQALELLLRRGGLPTLCLPIELRRERVGNALRALAPRALVLAGAGGELSSIGGLVYAAREVCGEIDVYDFGGAIPDTGAGTVHRLGSSPIAATQTLRSRLLSSVGCAAG
jgi:MerR family transcriptional regulator, light-induced transcriptional regulator